MHYLAFDLFVGAWETRDAVERGISRWILAPCLLLTFLFGPIGWLAYQAARMRARTRGSGMRPHARVRGGALRKELMPIVSITRIRVRSWSYLPAFFVQTLRIARQAARADGSLAVALLRDRRNTFWTSTSWSSEAR